MRLKLILKVVVGLVLALGVVEAGLRYVGYPASYSGLFTFDKELGYRYAPGNRRFFTGNDRYSVFIDRYGILDHVGRGQAEVLILGDGFVAGLELPAAERLATRVYNSSKLKTLNLSVPGYGTVQQWLAMRRWITENGPPDHVFIVYNFANDYFDNVPAWESSRVPGVQAEGSNFSLVPPVQPSAAGQIARKIYWNSRVCSVLAHASKRFFPVNSAMPEQQKLLYSTKMSDDSSRGNEATRFAVDKIKALRDQHGFTLTWIGWRDLGLELQGGVSQEEGLIAEQNIEVILGEERFWKQIIKASPKSAEEVHSWEEKWLHPGTRHASSATIERIAARIAVGIEYELTSSELIRNAD